MGNSWSRKSHTSYGAHEHRLPGLKMEAQKITEFSGKPEDWNMWKSRTECELDGSGYEEIIQPQEFANDNPTDDRVVYSQLAVATINGNAYFLVKKCEDSKSGYMDWQALTSWYDGEEVKAVTVHEKIYALENLKVIFGWNGIKLHQ